MEDIYKQMDRLHKLVTAFPNYNELRMKAAWSQMLELLGARLIEPLGNATFVVLQKLAKEWGVK